MLSLGECDTGAGVLERISREHVCVRRVSTIPQTVLDLVHICLAPGDDQSELRNHRLMVTTPPLLCLPSLCASEGQTFGQPMQRHTLYTPITQLEACLYLVSRDHLNPLIDTEESLDKESRSLPLVIRERDVKYQSSRVVRYRRLLQAFPHRKMKICSEALVIQ